MLEEKNAESIPHFEKLGTAKLFQLAMLEPEQRVPAINLSSGGFGVFRGTGWGGVPLGSWCIPIEFRSLASTSIFQSVGAVAVRFASLTVTLSTSTV